MVDGVVKHKSSSRRSRCPWAPSQTFAQFFAGNELRRGQKEINFLDNGS